MGPRKTKPPPCWPCRTRSSESLCEKFRSTEVPTWVAGALKIPQSSAGLESLRSSKSLICAVPLLLKSLLSTQRETSKPLCCNCLKRTPDTVSFITQAVRGRSRVSLVIFVLLACCGVHAGKAAKSDRAPHPTDWQDAWPNP